MKSVSDANIFNAVAIISQIYDIVGICVYLSNHTVGKKQK